MNIGLLWRQWRQRHRFESELDEELRFHLDCRAEALQRDGLDRAEALRRARIELGSVELHKDAVRSASGLDALDALFGELARGLRSLLRAPVFLIGTVTVLALSVALNLVMFGLHQTYLGSPPETARPGLLVDLDLRTVGGNRAPWLTLEEASVLRDALGPTVQHLALAGQVALGHGGESPRTLHGMAVDSHYFRMLAAGPALGRAFEAGDDDVPQHRIVLSHAAWLSLMAGDRSVLGRDMLLGGEAWSVVGVMPSAFAGLEPFRPQFWIEAGSYQDWRRRNGVGAGPVRYAITLQLAHGVSAEALEQRVQAALAALPGRTVEDERITAARLLPRTGQLSVAESEDAALLLAPIHGLLLLVLLVACANLANLMLARVLARRRELAIRAGIGASRLRLVGLLMLEAGLLAAIGSALGLVLALVSADAVHGYAASVMASVGMQALDIRFSPMVLPVTFALAALATLAIGLVPALAVTTGDLSQATRVDGGLTAGRVPSTRLRGSLMVVQVAASAVLLVVAAFAVHVAQRAGTLDVGYPTEALVDLRHPAPDRVLLEDIQRLAGVHDAAAIAPVPLYGHTWPGEVIVDGATNVLSVHYADQRVREVLGLRLLAGRWFSEQEARAAAPVAVIGAATAARLWPGQAPLGRQVAVVDPDEAGGSRTIDHDVIGVVGEVATGLLISGIDDSALWLPGHAESSARPLRDWLLRIDSQRSGPLLASLAHACLHRTRAQPCTPWRLSDVAAWQRMPLEIARSFAVGIGLMALLISAAGLWGGVAYTVAARSHEIGVRRALGARGEDIVRLVLGGTLRQISLGLLIAAIATAVLSIGLARHLEGSSTAAIPVFIAVAVLLVGTALMATVIPVRRATAIAPTQALRES